MYKPELHYEAFLFVEVFAGGRIGPAVGHDARRVTRPGVDADDQRAPQLAAADVGRGHAAHALVAIGIGRLAELVEVGLVDGAGAALVGAATLALVAAAALGPVFDLVAVIVIAGVPEHTED